MEAFSACGLQRPVKCWENPTLHNATWCCQAEAGGKFGHCGNSKVAPMRELEESISRLGARVRGFRVK